MAVKHTEREKQRETHTHTHRCSSPPDRKCGSDRNTTSHNLTFTTCRGPPTSALLHAGVQMQKKHKKKQECLKHENISSVTYMGLRCEAFV